MQRRKRESFHQWRVRVINDYESEVGGRVSRALVRSARGVAVLASALEGFRSRVADVESIRQAALAREAFEELLRDLGDEKAQGVLSDRELEDVLAAAGWLPRSYIEVLGDGRVIWFESSHRAEGTPPGLRPEEYDEIISGLDPQAMYGLYLRTVSGAALAAEEAGRGYLPGADRGAHVSDYWRPFALAGRVERLRGGSITRGRLESISIKLAKEQTKGYVVGWLLALVRALPEDRAWLSMRHGETNCVAKLVRAALGAKKAGRGGMTAAREQTLRAFEARVAENGAEVEDIQWLCTQLRWRIELRGLDEELLWGPVNRLGAPAYAGDKQQAPLTIYRSNGHAFLERPIMPKATSVRVYNDASKRNPGESLPAYEARLSARLSEVILERGILRGFVVGREVVDDAGVVHRPIGCDMALCELDGAQGEGPDYDIGPNGEPIKVLHVGGVQSYRFKKWREAQEIESLPPDSSIRSAWRSANFEAVPWCDASEEDLCGSSSYDMRAAYLACGPGSVGEGRTWSERCGFPGGGRQMRAAVNDLTEVEKLAGCVRFLSLELAPDCPECIKAQMAYHLEKDSWLPIPMALYLRDSGLLREHRLEQVVYSLKRLKDVSFPARDWAVRFIGSCRYKSDRQTLWTRDEAEAGFYEARYADKAVTVMKAGEGFLVSFDTAKPRKDHSFVRAYVLGYLFIGMAEAIRAIPEGELLACKVDSLTLRRGGRLPENIPQAGLDVPKGQVAYGTFLPKAVSNQGRTDKKELRTRFDASTTAPTNSLGEDSLYEHALSFLDGQGGAGKTYRALRAFPGRRVVVLGKDNDHLQDLATPEKNPHGYPARTYHEYFHLGGGKWCDWDPSVMGRQRPDVVVWDEFGHVHPSFLAMSLAWLRSVGAQVVLCGDPTGQLPPFDEENEGRDLGAESLALLQALGAHREFMEKDYRAKDCEELQGMKRRAWRVDDDEQLAVLRELPLTPLIEVMAAWSPEDTIVVSTNEKGKEIASLVAIARRERFPGAPVRIRFRPEKEARKAYQKKGGKLPFVLTPDGRSVPAVIGHRQVISPETWMALYTDDSVWVDDSWVTVHSVQGRTVKAPGRLILVEDGMNADWCHNAIYTALSRAEKKSQLVRTTLRG